jgi:hypothetical protein
VDVLSVEVSAVVRLSVDVFVVEVVSVVVPDVVAL